MLIEAATPLAFWRKKRGVSGASLATFLGISQPHLAQIETGKRLGDVSLYAKLTTEVRIRIEDLLDECS